MKLNSNLYKIFFFLVFAIAFLIRIQGLDKKFYWIDEVSSSFVITGNWPEQIEEKLSINTGSIITVANVLEALENNSETDSIKLLSTLSKRDPQHSPLYFLIAQKWSLFFGTRAENLRLLASVFGFLSLVAFTWLSFELFKSKFVALLSASILALAPFHILYSQQNREYSLWFFMICLSTAILLAANRTGKKTHWFCYGLSVSAGLYSFLFFLPFLFAHVLFQFSDLNQKQIKQIKLFFLALLIGVVSFLPWLINMALSFQKVDELNQWSSKPVSAAIYFQSMILNFSRLFTDFNLQSFQPLPTSNVTIMLSLVLIVIIIAFSVLFSSSKLKGANKVLFISILIIPLLFLLSIDIVKGGIHALVGRHLLPTWTAVYLAIGFLIADLFLSKKIILRIFSSVLYALIIFFSIQFNFNYLPEKRWWPLKPQNLADASEEVIASNSKILITSFPTETKQFISLNYYLDRSFPVLLFEDDQSLPNLKSYLKIAVFRPSSELIELLSAEYSMKKFNDELWIGNQK